MPQLEERFGARVSSFPVKKELLPQERARMRLSWEQRAREKKSRKNRLTK